MKEQYNYIVLGAGRQGTAAAYDMALWGDASRVVLADINWEAARKATDRVNALLDRQIAEPAQVNVSDPQDLARKLEGMHACLSAVLYVYNLDITKTALESLSIFVISVGIPKSPANSTNSMPRRAPKV